MTTEKRNKLFRLTRKLIALSRRPATPENADRFFRHYLRTERISRGISPFKTLSAVPVLAESRGGNSRKGEAMIGEARESTKPLPNVEQGNHNGHIPINSRGSGQNILSSGVESRRQASSRHSTDMEATAGIPATDGLDTGGKPPSGGSIPPTQNILGGGGENNGQPRGSAVAAQFNFVPSKNGSK